MLALIPFWDMMNHQSLEVSIVDPFEFIDFIGDFLFQMTTDFNDEKRSLIFYSMDSYEPGDEVNDFCDLSPSPM